MENTLAHTKETAQKEAAALIQEVENTQTLKKQRSMELHKQHDDLKSAYTERLTDLQENSNAEIESLKEQLTDAHKLQRKRSAELKGIFQTHLTDLKNSSQGTINALQEQLDTTRAALQNSDQTILEKDNKLEEQKTLRHQRSRELQKAKMDNEQLTRLISEEKERAQELLERTKSGFVRDKQQLAALEQERSKNLNEKISALATQVTEKTAELKAALDRINELNALLASSKSNNTIWQQLLLETKKALEDEKAKCEKLSKDLLSKSTQAARQAGRVEGRRRSNRSPTIVISEDDPEVREISPVEEPEQFLQHEQDSIQGEEPSQGHDAATTLNEQANSGNNSLDLSSESRPVLPQGTERIALRQQATSMLPPPPQNSTIFELGLGERELDYQASLSSGTPSLSSQSDVASEKSSKSTASRLSMKSIASSLWNREHHDASQDEVATRSPKEDPDNPSGKLRKSVSVTSLQSTNSNTSDIEFGPLKDASKLDSMYQASKKDRHFNLLDAIYNDNPSEFNRILSETRNAWKQQDKNKRNPLHWAALLNRHQCIKALLEPLNKDDRDRLLNQKDRDGLTPLLHAADQNSVETADILANQYGADTSIKSAEHFTYQQNVFQRAAEKGRSRFIQTLLPNAPIELISEQNEKTKKTPLMDLAELGKSKVSRALLKREGINTLARDKGHKDAFYLAVEYGVKNNDWKPVEKFLTAKYKGVLIPFEAHPDELEYSAFALLVAHAPKHIIERALKFRGFNLNQSIFKKDWANGYEYLTPFDLAVQKGHIPGAEALLQDERAKPNTLTQVQKRTPMHVAMRADQPEMVKLLFTSPIIAVEEKQHDAKGWSAKRHAIRNAATQSLEAFQQYRSGKFRPLEYRQKDVDAAEMKQSDKAPSLKAFLEKNGKKMRFR